MKARSIIFALAVPVLGLSLFFCAPALSQRGPTTHFVDFERGSDTRDGLTAATAWRHAPGDPQATGMPAAWKLSPGDRVLFTPGTRYRGAIVVNGNGTAAAPIVFASAPGAAPAIIDGSDSVAAMRPCQSADECGGVANWRQLTRIELAAPAPPGAVLFSESGLLTKAQHPNMPDPFYSDDVEHFLPVAGEELAKGRAPLPKDLLQRIATPGERFVAVWVRGNLVHVVPVTGLADDAALFDPQNFKFYTDRPDRVAAVGHPALIDTPREYAFLEGRGIAVALLPDGAGPISIASGRGGIDLHGASHVLVRGLAFEHMMAPAGDTRAGVPLMNAVFRGENIRIEGNRFSRHWLANGQGAINLRGIKGVIVEGNTIDTVAIGSGIRLAKLSDATVVRNRVHKVGRTGIMVMSVVGAEVRENTITDIQGVHGNGMSVYLDNQNVRVIGNTIAGSTRPATFHGGKTASDNGVVFACNLFVGSRDSVSALTSWSGQEAKINRLAIDRNVLLGGKLGARLSGADRAVTITGNVTNGVKTRDGGPGADWTMSGNDDRARAGTATPLSQLEDLRRKTCNEPTTR